MSACFREPVSIMEIKERLEVESFFSMILTWSRQELFPPTSSMSFVFRYSFTQNLPSIHGRRGFAVLFYS